MRRISQRAISADRKTDSSRPSRPRPPDSATRRHAALVIEWSCCTWCSTVPTPAKKIPVDIACTTGFQLAVVTWGGGNGVVSAAIASSSWARSDCVAAGAYLFICASKTARPLGSSREIAAWYMACRPPASWVTWIRVAVVSWRAARDAETSASSWLSSSPDSVLLMIASDWVAEGALVRLAFSLMKSCSSWVRMLLNAPNTSVGVIARARTAGRMLARPWMLASICRMTSSSAVVADPVVAELVILAWKAGNAWVVAFWAATSWARLVGVGAAR